MDEQLKKAEDQYFRLRGLLEVGRITRAQFDAALKELVVQDAEGRWWTLDADSGKWIALSAPTQSELQRMPEPPRSESARMPVSPPTMLPTELPRAPRDNRLLTCVILGASLVLVVLVLVVFALVLNGAPVSPSPIAQIRPTSLATTAPALPPPPTVALVAATAAQVSTAPPPHPATETSIPRATATATKPAASTTPTPTPNAAAAGALAGWDKGGKMQFGEPQRTKVRDMLKTVLETAPYDVTADEIESLVQQYAGKSFRASWNARFASFPKADFDTVFQTARLASPGLLLQQTPSIGPLHYCPDTCWLSDGSGVELTDADVWTRPDGKQTLFKELYGSRTFWFCSTYKITSEIDVGAFGERLSFAYKLAYANRHKDWLQNPDSYLKLYAERSITDGYHYQ
jgi:hypothetical protein